MRVRKPLQRMPAEENDFGISRQQGVREFETRRFAEIGVEQRQIWRLIANQAQSAARRSGGPDDAITAGFEDVLQITGDERFVFDDKNRLVLCMHEIFQCFGMAE